MTLKNNRLSSILSIIIFLLLTTFAKAQTKPDCIIIKAKQDNSEMMIRTLKMSYQILWSEKK